MQRRRFHLFVLATLSVGGCAFPRDDGSPLVSQVQTPDAGRTPCIEPPAALEGAPLTPFRDAAELERYLVAATTHCRYELLPDGADPHPLAARTSTLSRVTDARQPSSSDPQTSGGRAEERWSVADGTIVRRGALLFVLRDRVVTVLDLGVQGAPREVDVQAVPPHGDTRYDGQLRVSGEYVYVIETSAEYWRSPKPTGTALPTASLFAPAPPRAMHTHITTFRLRDEKLTLAGRTLIEYSRMKDDVLPWVQDGELVLLLNHDLIGDFKYEPRTGFERGSMRTSRVLHRDAASASFVPKGPLFSASDVYRPLHSRSDAVHSLVRCRPAPDGQLGCSAKAFIMPERSWRHLLQTDDRLFLAANDEHAYSVSLTDFDVTVHRMSGYAYGQRTIEHEGALHFPSLEMNEEWTHGQVVMWSLPRAAFDKRGEQPASGRRVLGEWDATDISISRDGFIGSTYVGHVNRWWNDVVSEVRVIYDVAESAPAHIEVVDGPTTMVPVGSDRVAFVSELFTEPENHDLGIELWGLKPHLALQSQLTLPTFRADAERSLILSRQNGDPVLVVPALIARELAFVGVVDGKLRAIGTVGIDYDFDRCQGGCFGGPMLAFSMGERTFMVVGGALVEIDLTAAAAIGQTYTFVRLD